VRGGDKRKKKKKRREKTKILIRGKRREWGKKGGVSGYTSPETLYSELKTLLLVF